MPPAGSPVVAIPYIDTVTALELFQSDADNDVNMVRPNIDAKKRPIAFGAKISNCFLDRFATRSI